MNLLLAFVTINVYAIGVTQGVAFFSERGPQIFFLYLSQINLLLMLFNLIPLGALDGHYILPYFLPRRLARRYVEFNHRYGNFALLGLIVLALLGVPVFRTLMNVAESLLQIIVLV